MTGRTPSYLVAGATLVTALAIGYVVQYGAEPAEQAAIQPPADARVVEIATPGAGVPRWPSDLATPTPPADIDAPVLPSDAVLVASVDLGAAGLPMPRGAPPGAEAGCKVDLAAETVSGAMVDLRLAAPCHADARVDIHHRGMMVSARTDATGQLEITVPALVEQAFFVAAFVDGSGVTARAEVPSLPLYDRVAVQWTGDAGLQLHAREFGAGYFQPGHVWKGAAGDLRKTVLGKSGFLVPLGDRSLPDARRAEVYTFPHGNAKTAGDVRLTVEAEVSPANCGREVEGQVFQSAGQAGVRVRDIALALPGCEALGNVVVLEDVVEDLRIASN